MKIGIIGCGNMGESLAYPLSEKFSLILYDKNHEKSENLARKIQARASSSAREAVVDSDLIILAIKPHQIQGASEEFSSAFRSEQLLISVLTGITQNSLHKFFESPKILRMMPNLAVRYGKGVIGLAENAEFSKETRDTIENICSCLGSSIWLKENQLNGLTSLTGSGPAFVYVMIESMIDAAIAMGFSSTQGRLLVLQMLKGAIATVEESKRHLGDLRWEVMSPAGTTVAGIHALEDAGVRSAILDAFLASYEKALSLSKESI